MLIVIGDKSFRNVIDLSRLLKYYMNNCSFVEAIHISSFTDTLIDKLESNNDIGLLNCVQIQTQCASLWLVFFSTFFLLRDWIYFS